MLSASLYLITCSARNRLRVRLTRLREPRYLIGAIVGGAYFYFTFFTRMRMSGQSAARRRERGAPPLPTQLAALMASGPAFGGLALLVVTAAGWLMPFDSGLLDFSEPEMQFLFPAPVTRRQLLIHRMLRSQLGLLFGALMIGVFSPLQGLGRLRMSVGTWMVFLTVKIYFTGITLARARLGSPDRRARRVAWLPIAALTAAITVVVTALVQAYVAHPPEGVSDTLALVGSVSLGGASRVVLWPFMAVVRPFFAEWPWPYLTALGWAGVVLLATVTWVLKSDEAFQDAAAEVAERKASGLRAKGASYRARSTGLTLAVTGRPETAFAWKAATQTLRLVDRRSLARMASVLFALTVAAVSIGRANGLASTVGIFSVVATAFAILFAPQVVRVDMRQDLSHLDLLKTWPVKASAMIRGEMAWPGILISASAWIAIGIALFMSAAVFSTVGLGLRVSAGITAAILAPALVFAQLTIHNTVALIFPAWVPLGNQRPRGLDAMGQRLIMLGGTWLLLAVMLLPGALAGGVIWFAFRGFLGAAVFVPAAVVCSVIVVIEVLLVTEALGPAYERLDITSVERTE